METSYNETIRDQKAQLDRLQRKLKLVQGEKINTLTEKNDIEALFVDCIEDVRKEVMKRRLKNEIIQKKKGLKIGGGNEEEAREFEESLMKLAQLAKHKVKIEDFT